LTTTRRARLQVARAVVELTEHPARLAGVEKRLLGFDAPAQAHRLESVVLGQTKDEIDALGLAPGHDVLATEAAVATDDDAHLRPGRAQQGEEAREFFHTACRGVDVGFAQPRAEHMFAAGDVQRQVAIVAVIAVEEASFLMTRQRIVGGVEVEPKRLRRRIMGADEVLHQHPVQARLVGDDLVVARLAVASAGVSSKRFSLLELASALPRSCSRRRSRARRVALA
jgi:hypothetical protein